MCVGPQRAFCGPRSSSETRTRTQRHVRHTLDTRRQKSQVSQSGQLLNLCFERRKKTKCLLQLSKQLKKIFCFQQHLKKTRENNPEWCISARVAWNSFAIPCSSSALLFAATFEEKQHSAHHRFCVRIFCFLGPSSMDSCPMHARQFVRDFFRPGLKCGGLCSVTSLSPPTTLYTHHTEKSCSKN